MGGVGEVGKACGPVCLSAVVLLVALTQVAGGRQMREMKVVTDAALMRLMDPGDWRLR